MRVVNIHERLLAASAGEIGVLLDSLGSTDDRLWPRNCWPSARFDRALAVGADGGHGPVRYFVERYVPGQLVEFRFTAPGGFNGTHRYEVLGEGPRLGRLRHVLDMDVTGLAALSWLLVFRPLHEALIEDSLSKAAGALGLPTGLTGWSIRVKLLRWLMTCVRRWHTRFAPS